MKATYTLTTEDFREALVRYISDKTGERVRPEDLVLETKPGNSQNWFSDAAFQCVVTLPGDL